MKKEELFKIKLPLSRKDFERLKRAMDYEEIERGDFPEDLLPAMDQMWFDDNQIRYEELYKSGLMGEYD